MSSGACAHSNEIIESKSLVIHQPIQLVSNCVCGVSARRIRIHTVVGVVNKDTYKTVMLQ